jgi:hypothetical protein
MRKFTYSLTIKWAVEQGQKHFLPWTQFSQALNPKPIFTSSEKSHWKLPQPPNLRSWIGGASAVTKNFQKCTNEGWMDGWLVDTHFSIDFQFPNKPWWSPQLLCLLPAFKQPNNHYMWIYIYASTYLDSTYYPM